MGHEKETLSISGAERVSDLEDAVEAVRHEFLEHEKKDVDRHNSTNGRVDKVVWQMSVIILIGGLVLSVGKDWISKKLLAGEPARLEAREK